MSPDVALAVWDVFTPAILEVTAVLPEASAVENVRSLKLLLVVFEFVMSSIAALAAVMVVPASEAERLRSVVGDDVPIPTLVAALG
jgi:hypothetical protein